LEDNKYKIGIVGLGYVGLPLAVSFSNKFKVVAVDTNYKRTEELNNYIDNTNEVTEDELKQALNKNLKITSLYNNLKDCNIFIITVPTPVTKEKLPDLSFLYSASESIGKILKKGDIVIYESTVYPGCTEEDCVPILEKSSGLKYNKDFYCGYSPERINPGDKVNKIENIIKVTSGSTPSVANEVNQLYASIIKKGTHMASSIKVAEASKAIENAQRDLNISFVNELAIIFDKMGIDTNDVLNAASTKWNFLNFRPGLVGGHCISVDPYYLVHKSKKLGYTPDVILSGRKVNDNMGSFVGQKLINKLYEKKIKLKNSKVLILGITYKENCPDIRNTKIPDIISYLKNHGILVEVYDPYASIKKVKKEFQIELIGSLNNKVYDGIILAVAHDKFKDVDIKQIKNKHSVVFDIKAFLNQDLVDIRL
tara:strand:- start:19027 stop:20298 length:1272 start_codon:yes stop_codon:yes gene_type:complete